MIVALRSLDKDVPSCPTCDCSVDLVSVDVDEDCFSREINEVSWKCTDCKHSFCTTNYTEI